MKKIKLLLHLTALVCVFFAACENPIVEKWWEEPGPEYVPIKKNIPVVTQQTVYETIYKQVVQYVPEYIYQTITEYQTVYQKVIEEVPMPVTEEDVIEYIKKNFDKVMTIINESPDKEEIIKTIIQSIPADKMVDYLTVDQIQYILEQQPAHVILQTINIIDIEYIIFAGNAEAYNGPHGDGGNTDLTDEEKSSNDKSVAAIAKALKDNPDYLIMLHGHANPTEFTESEKDKLEALSLSRANAVEAELKTQFKKLSGTDIEDTRVSVSGYGGEKTLYGSNTAYAALNRRVEMILIRLGVDNNGKN